MTIHGKAKRKLTKTQTDILANVLGELHKKKVQLECVTNLEQFIKANGYIPKGGVSA